MLGGADSASCLPFNGTTLSCNFGTLTQGATRTVTLTSDTQAADCGAVNNTATVSAPVTSTRRTTPTRA